MDQIHNMRWLYEMTECTIPRCYQSQSTPSINAGRPRRATQHCYWPIKYCKSEPYSSEYFEALILAQLSPRRRREGLPSVVASAARGRVLSEDTCCGDTFLLCGDSGDMGLLRPKSSGSARCPVQAHPWQGRGSVRSQTLFLSAALALAGNLPGTV